MSCEHVDVNMDTDMHSVSSFVSSSEDKSASGSVSPPRPQNNSGIFHLNAGNNYNLNNTGERNTVLGVQERHYPPTLVSTSYGDSRFVYGNSAPLVVDLSHDVSTHPKMNTSGNNRYGETSEFSGRAITIGNNSDRIFQPVHLPGQKYSPQLSDGGLGIVSTFLFHDLQQESSSVSSPISSISPPVVTSPTEESAESPEKTPSIVSRLNIQT